MDNLNLPAVLCVNLSATVCYSLVLAPLMRSVQRGTPSISKIGKLSILDRMLPFVPILKTLLLNLTSLPRADWNRATIQMVMDLPLSCHQGLMEI